MLTKKSMTGAALTSLTVWLTSCAPSHPERVPLFAAKGRVFLDGKPVSGIELRFYPDPPRPDDLTPVARSKDDGSFALTTYESEDGAPPGRYKVGLRRPETNANVLSGPKPDRLREQYRDPSKTPWRVEITNRETTLKDIQIPSPSTQDDPSKKGSTNRSKPSKSQSHDGPRARPKTEGISTPAGR